MSEVKYILDPDENKEFRILANDLNIFCEDLGLYVNVNYFCSPKKKKTNYDLFVKDKDNSKYYVDYAYISFYPNKDLYSVTLYYDHSNGYQEFVSTDESVICDIYDLVTNHIKKVLGGNKNEMDKETE